MKKKKTKSKKILKLIRFLEPGQKIRAIGPRGKPVKRIVSGREYVLEVRKGRKLVGYVNNLKKERGNIRTPIPKPFTRTMIARLMHSTRFPNYATKNFERGKGFRVKSNKRMRSQIPKSAFREMDAKKKGKGFRLRINTERGDSLVSPTVYIDNTMDDEAKKNLIVSQFLFTIGRENLRISEILKGAKHQRRHLIHHADIFFEYRELPKFFKPNEKESKVDRPKRVLRKAAKSKAKSARSLRRRRSRRRVGR